VKVTQFAAKNYKRLRYVEMKPEGELVIVGGRNAQGKTSALDALADALSGTKTKALEPVRKGEDRADIIVKTDTGLTIRKYYTAAGGYGLRVQTDDGMEVPGAAAYLGQFFNSLTFDPLEFARADEKRQASTLRRLAGIDTTELDASREEAFTSRTVVNRRVRDLEGELKSMGDRPMVAGKVVDVTTLLTQQQTMLAVKEQNDAVRRDHAGRLMALDNYRQALARLLQEREDLSARIIVAEHNVKDVMAEIETLSAQVAIQGEPNLAGIREAIANAQTSNAGVGAAKRWDQTSERLDAAKQEAQALTDQLDVIDTKKLAQLRDAKYPLPTLEVDAAGHVLYAGVPFSQASAAEQVKVSAACGLALKPELRVLIIRDGSLLDDDSMASLEALAVEYDAQLFIERVGTVGASVVIEDGEVVS
jgi:energy-coupling factor transporter ATP-binding protein EcfA2